ncbi:MAG: glycosyltransferase family 4 protein [Bryobacteraceae bacterium]
MADKRLKIGYLMQAEAVPMSDFSGPRSHVCAVFEGLKARGHQVRMVAIQNGNTFWTDDVVDWAPARFSFTRSFFFRIIESPLRRIQSAFTLPFFRFFDSVKFADACISALAGYDVLYERFGMMSSGGLLASKWLGIPIILEVNGDLVEEYKQQKLAISRTQWWAINVVTKWMFCRADRIVAVGETIKRRILGRWRFDSSKVSVIPNGADVELFASSRPNPVVCSRYMLDSRPFVIFVGSFQPWHGVDLLLKAFQKVSAVCGKAQLALVGDGALRPATERTATELGLDGHVVFTGVLKHEELGPLLASAEVAVICHRAEAAEIVESPLKLFEYMAAGKAIVAPAVPNMRRILTDRVNALLVPPDDVDALAQALIELLESRELRASLGKTAQTDALARHSWAQTVSEVENLMLDAVTRRAG